MEPTLERRFHRLEQQREHLLGELQPLPPSVLEFRSQPGSWNILEVLDHLLRSDKAVAAQLAQYRGSRQPVPFKNLARHLMVRAVMRSPLRVRVPSTVVDLVTPHDVADLQPLCAAWAIQRQILRSVLESFSRSDLRFAVFRHPVAGWTTVDGSLQFIDSHVAHHRFQIDRLARRAPKNVNARLTKDKALLG